MSNGRYYEPRRSVSAVGFVATAITAVLSGIAVGAVIGPLDFYDPFRIFAFVGVLLGGASIGWAVFAVARMMRVRHDLVRCSLAAVGGLIAVYTLWYVCVLLQTAMQETIGVFTIFGYMEIFADPNYMRWNIGGFPAGPVRYLFYVFEAMLIVFAAMSTASQERVPFCESCNDWSDEQEDVALLAKAEDNDALRVGLERERYEMLDKLRVGEIDESDCLRVTVYTSPDGGEENYLTVKHVSEDGDVEDVVSLLRIPRRVARSLMRPVGERTETRIPLPNLADVAGNGRVPTEDETPATV